MADRHMTSSASDMDWRTYVSLSDSSSKSDSTRGKSLYRQNPASISSDETASLNSVCMKVSQASNSQKPLYRNDFSLSSSQIQGLLDARPMNKSIQRNMIKLSSRKLKDLLAEETAKFKRLLGSFGRYILDLYCLTAHDFLYLLKEEDPLWPSDLLHLKSRINKHVQPLSPVFTPLDADEHSRDQNTPSGLKTIALMHLYYVYFQEIFVSLFISVTAMESGYLDILGKLENIIVSTDVHTIHRTASGLSCSSSECSECVVCEIDSNSSGNSIGSSNESRDYVYGHIFDRILGVIPSKGCAGTLVNSCGTEGELSRKIHLARRLMLLSPSGISELSPACEVVAKILSVFREDKLSALSSSSMSLESLNPSVLKMAANDVEKILWNLEIGLFHADVSTPDGKSDVIRQFVSSICHMSSAEKCVMNYGSKENIKSKADACNRIFSTLKGDYAHNMGRVSSHHESKSVADSDSVAYTDEEYQTLESNSSSIPRKFLEDPRGPTVPSNCYQSTKYNSVYNSNARKPASEYGSTFYMHDAPHSWSK